MQRSSGLIRVAGLLCLAWSLLAATPAVHAQDRLASSILTATTLTQQQLDDIEKYVDSWIKVLLDSEDPELIATARDKLTEPIRNQLTTEFVRGTIGSAVADRIGPAVNAERLATRLNALIVASNLASPKVAPLAQANLDHQSPAIRYWAAKSIAEVMDRSPAGGNPIFPDEAQQGILDGLKKVMPGEKSGVVLEQQFRALAKLRIGGALDVQIDIFNNRVAEHAREVNDGLRADEAALADLEQKLIFQIANGQNVRAELKQLTAIAAKYLQVCAKALSQNKLDANLSPVAIRTIQTVQKIFNLALSQFAPDWPGDRRPQLPPNPLEPNILMLNTLDWVGTAQNAGILTQSGIGIPYEDMKLPEPAKAPANTPPAPGADAAPETPAVPPAPAN